MFQKKAYPSPDAISSAVPPWQSVVDDAVSVSVGSAATVYEDVPDLEQPVTVSVTTTLYVVLEEGETVVTDVVAFVLHRKLPALVSAVSVMALPWQITVDAGRMERVGDGVTEMVVAAMLWQPLAVTRTV